MTTGTSNQVKFLLCHVGSEMYALEMARVRDLSRADLLEPDEDSDQLAGVLPGPDGPIPVFRLGTELGRMLPATDAKHVVLTEAGGTLVGLLVDRVAQTAARSAVHLPRLPGPLAGTAPQYFEGVLRHEEALSLILNPEGLFGVADRADRRRFPANRWDDLALPRSAGGKVVQFSLGEQRYRGRPLTFGVCLSRVLEIMELPAVTPIPGTAPAVAGLVEWRQRPVAVLDLAARLQLPVDKASARGRVMVARIGADNDPLGLVVRPPVRILSAAVRQQPCPSPVTPESELVCGSFHLKDAVLSLLDIAHL